MQLDAALPEAVGGLDYESLVTHIGMVAMFKGGAYVDSSDDMDLIGIAAVSIPHRPTHSG